MLVSAGLTRIGASACPQGDDGNSQPYDCSQSSYVATIAMGSLSIADKVPSRVLCTLEEEVGALSVDEVLSDDGPLDGLDLQLVCKESRVSSLLYKLEDSRDEPSPLYSLPPVPL